MKTCTCGIDINNHPASDCLNLLVAEKVMGWYVSPSGLVSSRNKPGDFVIDACEETPFSTDIAYAWLVVEKILELPCSVNIQRDFHSDGNHTACYIHEYPRDDTPLIMAHAKTTPLAICRAALLTVEK